MPHRSENQRKRHKASVRLRQARVDAGFHSAAAAALALGVRPSTYAAHENGQNDITADQSASYAKMFGCDAAWLVGLDRETIEGAHSSEPLISLLQSLVSELRRLNALLAGDRHAI